MTLVLGIWLAFGLFDPMFEGNLLLTRIIRFGVVAPICAAVIALSYAPSAVFARWWQLGMAVGFAAIAGAMLVFDTFQPEEVARATSAGGVALVIVGGYTLVMMRFIYAVPVSAAVTIGFAAQQVHLSGAAGISTKMVENGLVWVLLANVIGAIACRELEKFRRAQFAQRRALERERKRAETLLFNTLPRTVVERFKRGEPRIVDDLDPVTVMFGDLVGFTALTERISSHELVDLLNELYTEFDHIAERHGLEKIKTVGDAYMVVGGAPLPRDDHATAVVEMALDMLDAVRQRGAAHGPLEIRIGIHSGPVVAGVIGTRKLSYDVWGDTVNVASRLQSHGVPGAIQVSSATKEFLLDRYQLEARGEVDLKGKGMTETYLLSRR